MTLEPGQQLLHYRLIQKIGEGGMGVVWKAEDTKLGRQIALKVLPEAMAVDPERRARFEREARAVAALNHPNIVTLHSVEESDGVHFITMELVEGRNLTELLPKDGFPLPRLLEIATPLADAVSSAHRAGITHRDLKPDNVMIDGEGRLRVLDFGLAKHHDTFASTGKTQAATVTSDTASGRILGTVAYMSPEQAEGKNVDARSDIFSLGTMLYEMASGERPFRGDTTMSTIGSILKDEPASITDVQPSLPRHAGRIIRRCLAKDPERRYQTALDVRNELEELKGEIEAGIHAAEPADVATAIHRPKGSRLPIVLGVLLLFVLGAALTISLWNRDDTAALIYNHRPVTATNHWDGSASWSPDGKFIAFNRMKFGSSDIYIKPIDGGEAVARVEGPGDQGSPRWSPDRRLLAYVSNQPGTPVLLVPPDGGNPKALIPTNLPALSSNKNSLLGDRPWSSDGKTLLVSRSVDGGPFAIHRVDRETGESERLTLPPAGSDDSTATYSFDHERILFRRGEMGAFGRMTLMVMPAAGGDSQPLYEDRNIVTAAWRPDGRRIVFLKARSLWELDVATRKTRQLASWTKRVQGLSVSSDDRLVYEDFWHDQFLYLVDVATGEREQITAHASNNGGARFAPNGRAIAYASNRTDNSEIWLYSLDDRSETQLTGGDARYTHPDWSPDGRRLVVRSDRNGDVPKMFVVSADGAGGARLLVDQPIDGGMNISAGARHRWSPDGALISYPVVGEEGLELWTVRPDGEGARRRIDGVSEFDWYRDSRRGLVTRLRGSETELSAVDLETGQEQPLFMGAIQEIDVAPDDRAVSFLFGRGHFSMGLAVLKLAPPSDPSGLPTAVGEPEYVVPAEGTWHVHSGGWSPDSRRIAYTHDQDYGDIYELVESVDDGE